MKKSLLLGFAAVAAVSLVSCDKHEDNSYQTSIAVPVYNLFTPINGDGNPFVGSAIYSFTVVYPAETITISTNNLSNPNGTSGSFTTKPLSFDAKYYTVDDTGRESISVKSQDPNDSGISIYDLNCLLTQAVYFPPRVTDTDALPEYHGLNWHRPISSYHYVFAQFQYGDDYNVRSFWYDQTFKGQTITSYPSGTGMTTYNTEGISYRVVMQLKKDGSISDKADLIMYDAKFAEPQPELSYIVLKDLNLQFTNEGYTITGDDVIPLVAENGEYTPYPAFVFNNFKASVSGNLTGVSMAFTVAGRFSGNFTGSCIANN